MVPPPSGPLERRAWVAAVMARVAAVAAAEGGESGEGGEGVVSLLHFVGGREGVLVSDRYYKFVSFVCFFLS